MSFDFLTSAVKGVQTLQPYQPGKPVSELARELGLDEAGIVKLASNENPLGPSKAVLDVIHHEMAELSRYPDGGGFELKSALSEKLKVDAEAITLGNGSNDVLDLIVRSWVAPGDEVVFSEHAFAVYPISTLAASGVPVKVPAVDYGHDLDAMAEAITEKTRVVFIANPNNPTGTWLSRDAIADFLKKVPERVLVVLDEAYCEYIAEPSYPDGLQWLGQYSNLVVTRTFSKIYGLAGLRVGYSISSAAIAGVLNRVRHPFNVNSLALAAAVAALGDDDYVDQSRKLNSEGMALIRSGLEKLGLGYISSLGNFLTFDTGQSGEAVYNALLRRGVIVRPVTGYGLPQHLRVSIGTMKENQSFLDALPDALAEVVSQ
ncbi:histidinol-phosphate transaminase [Parendozoicomonas sp. Alg238-R29]|uniref:histidinol-phosphate transaminase n=1 Tax=Parendozoicomonas sp. Alg238-R29 TaxID=2993446 RepID=UPI00248D9398|nr:histidinol-phosphate transaminase [Parendozoicomonas sp. Alg238-R29]